MQRGRHDPEHRERRVAAADLRLAGEDGPEATLARDALELRAGIGDRDELGAAPAGLLPEVLEVRTRLEGRPRLRGDDEERPLELEAGFEPANRSRMRRVENVERLDLERPAEHLGREARAAHAEQHRVVELLARAGRERVQLVHLRPDPGDDVEPAEPTILVAAGPDGGVVGPDPLDERRHAVASSLRLARIPSSSSSNESANFCTPSRSSVSVTSS